MTPAFRFAILAAALFCAGPAGALEFGSGPAPIAYEPGAPFALDAGAVIQIDGVYDGAGETRLYLIADDEWAPEEAQRCVTEFTIAPGAFSVSAPIAECLAGDGGALDVSDLKRLLLIGWDDENTRISRFGTSDAPNGSEPAAPDAAAAAGLDFGSGGAPISYEPGAPFSLSDDATVHIEGAYNGAGETRLYLVADDEWAPEDGQRCVVEFILAPGPFSVSAPLAGCVAEDGGAIDVADLKRLILFGWDDANTVIRRFGTGAAAPEAPNAETADARDRPEAAPRDFGGGRAPLARNFDRPVDLSAYDEIVIEGEITSDSGVPIVLRIDDGASSGYGSRYNLEIELPAGPFRLRAPLGGLRSPSGRLVNPRDIRLVHFWVFNDDAVINVTRFEARQAPRLPMGAVGYSFGHPDASVPPSFERIGPSDPRLSGEIVAVARPTPDPLVANGLRGVDTVRLADIAPGDYRVTVWSEDPGEWEWLPHPVRRVIRVNGVDLRREETTPQRWIAERYLAGLTREHGPDDDAYSAYGAWRGEARSADIAVGADGLLVELGGDGVEAHYISAILIEPAGQDAARQAVEETRAEWYREYWRLDPNWAAEAIADASTAARVTLARNGAYWLTDAEGGEIKAVHAVAAPGTGLRVTIEAMGSEYESDATARIVAPRLGETRLEGMLWTGQWRLERRKPEETLLSLADNTLLPTGAAPIFSDRPRRYEIWFETPADAAPGLYVGALEIETALGLVSAPIEIEILDVALPEAAEPAGFYLTEPPHLTWFAAEPLDRQRQAACDVRWMTRFDLLGTAPSIRPPRPGNSVATTLDLRLANDLGLTPPWLGYNPIRPLQFDYQPADGAALIAAVERELTAAGAAHPAWSVADELSNPGDSAHEVFWPWVDALRAAAPGITLAGHLNNPADRQYLSAFDVVVINEGFGLDPSFSRDLAARGLDVWYYNTWSPRVTAGYWLWATDASRYVQWHARMPTADPFDPIDGREGDVQALLPSAEICPDQPAVNRDFLRLAEGVVDQRWLLWLDQQTGPEAEALRLRLHERAENDGWAATRAGGDAEMIRIRAAIMSLAQ